MVLQRKKKTHKTKSAETILLQQNHRSKNIIIFAYSEVQGTRSYFVIGIVRYKRNNVELPPLLKNDVFQKKLFQVMCNCFVCFALS
jgi:hypothetical protein